MSTTIHESDTIYIVTIENGSDSFVYRWSKEIPEGQTIEEYLQNCKRESELLAQVEVDKEQQSTPVEMKHSE